MSTHPFAKLTKLAKVAWPLAVASLAAAGLTGCATEKRLWRLSPFSEGESSSAERGNLWPLAWFNRDGGSLLWPLVDYDRHGFAVRPLVSCDHDDVDVLFPLSHFDTRSGDGWALTGYSFGGNRGLFPLCNFGPEFNFATLAYWTQDGKGVSNAGLFPLANVSRDGVSWVGPAFWSRAGEHGDVDQMGLFPIAYADQDFGFFGPAWWRRDSDTFGLFPLFTHGEFSWYGPLWSTGQGDEKSFGVFPLAWDTHVDGVERFTVLPLYQHRKSAGDDLHLLLLPPTWWEDSRDGESHFVLPFYGHTEDAQSSHSFTLLGDAWTKGVATDAPAESGLNVYPLYWSAHEKDESRQMLLPFYFYRERADDRLLLTPLGGRGWDANGESKFVNVLGPIYHHSEGHVGEPGMGQDVETTALLWPLFERDRTGNTTNTRVLPLFGVESTPSCTDSWQLFGLGRCVADASSTSFRAFPFYSQSSAASPPDPLFDWTLLHVATTDQGGAWRLWPFASGSSDASASGLLDELTLVRSTRSDDGAWSKRVFPLYWGSGDADSSSHTALLGLASVSTTKEGSAWRLWPLYSMTNGEGLNDWLDPVTLVGVHPHPDKTHVHVGTSLLFDLDRFGEEKRSWNVRALTFIDVGHDEMAPANPELPPCNYTAERDHAGFLFDWFLVENTVHVDAHGAKHDDAHYRLPLLHEYERTAQSTDWDCLCWSVSSEKTEQSDKFHVLGGYAFQSEKAPDHESVHLLGYAYRSDTKGDTTRRDIFPAVTWDSAPDTCRVSFLWKFFVYDRKGGKVGGNFFFIPWGDKPGDHAGGASAKSG
jgi:hypothetical protein